MFFTTVAGKDASDKYHKSGFQFAVFRIGGEDGGRDAPPTKTKISNKHRLESLCYQNSLILIKKPASWARCLGKPV
jgi:hypothetical protein